MKMSAYPVSMAAERCTGLWDPQHGGCPRLLLQQSNLLLLWLHQTDKLIEEVKLALNKLILHLQKFFPWLSLTAETALERLAGVSSSLVLGKKQPLQNIWRFVGWNRRKSASFTAPLCQCICRLQLQGQPDAPLTSAGMAPRQHGVWKPAGRRAPELHCTSAPFCQQKGHHRWWSCLGCRAGEGICSVSSL